MSAYLNRSIIVVLAISAVHLVLMNRLELVGSIYIYIRNYTAPTQIYSSIIHVVNSSFSLSLTLFFSRLQTFPPRLFRIRQRVTYVVDLDFEVPTSFDPFVDPDVSDTVSFSRRRGKEYAHIHIQQRNRKKCVTTVQGLSEDSDYYKVLKNLRKEFCCNGNVVQDKALGKIIQLQGDQRKKVSQYLVKKEHIKMGGF